jgi:hypothetical protein
MADPPNKPRTMTDANVLLAGNAFPRWPYEVLQHAVDGDFRLVLCPLIVKQARKHMRDRFPEHLPRLERFLREVKYELVPDPTQEQIDANQISSARPSSRFSQTGFTTCPRLTTLLGLARN